MSCWRLRAMLIASVFSLAVGACLSPTLPMPPPNDPKVALVSADQMSITFEGTGAIPGALVLIVNDDVRRGGVDTAGSLGEYKVTVPLDLSLHDQNRFLMWQTYGRDVSEVREFYRPSRGVTGGPGVADAGSDVPPGLTDGATE
jgi:hypothetical protein